MLLQLLGRLDPEESYAIISVPENILPQKTFTLELISIDFCHEATHEASHFPAAETATFPEAPPYEEYIEVRVPRPRPVVHRRRTMYITPLRAEEEEEEEECRFIRCVRNRITQLPRELRGAIPS